MNEIEIYVEGGGERTQLKAEIRNGLDVLLTRQKSAARNKRLRWNLIPCGGRSQTWDKFSNRVLKAANQTLLVLLVDSEEEIPVELSPQADETVEQTKQRLLDDAQVRRDYLTQRDGWDFEGIDPLTIHLMVQCMEAWIVSDVDALDKFYKSNFKPNCLPRRLNLEEEPKQSLYSALEQATRDTQKGAYGKIKHASKLLQHIDPNKVVLRCPRFKTFTNWLDDQIASA